MTTKEELKQIAELAAAEGFEWIAQNGPNRVWYGYTAEPTFNKFFNIFRPAEGSRFAPIEVPKYDLSKQIFEVKKILAND